MKVSRSTVESGYQVHINITRTFAICRMQSSCQNVYKLSLTGVVFQFSGEIVGGAKVELAQVKH